MSSRQTDLLAGADWTSIYRAFTQINFNATDPVSINQALRSYVQTSYPEKFNDWVVSSEFVAIADLLSWLAGTLAFKTDIAARENFIDTAESRESILRLARFLSYNPSRCQPATGVLKITEVMTDEDVFDSSGNDLANVPITWNDPINPNWQEQFTEVLNAAFVQTNPVGVPLSSGAISGVTTELYRVNGLARASNLSFTATVSGTAMPFEVCNGDFSDGGTLFERRPNPGNALQFFRLADNNGYASARTGYFLLFKQGLTSQQVFQIATPIQDQLLDLGVNNVNQEDVWVSTVDDLGTVQIEWTKVPAIFNSNITYNALANTVRTIYSVITRDNDQVTLRFSDGSFGLAPVGNIAVTYRVSNGLSYQIQPSEISNITLPIQYFNASGSPKVLSLTFSLFETVANAATAETVEQIRQRAPQVYGTQNRMVSGQDYNTFPLSSNLAVKINAVNRVYSGQSRYIDLHDPTGTYQDLSIFGDDGVFFADAADTYFEVPTGLNRTALQIFNDYLLPAVDQYTTSNLIRDVLMQNVLSKTIRAPLDIDGQPFTWLASGAALFDTTGAFVHDAARGQTGLPAMPAAAALIQPGALLQFSIAGVATWVAVVAIADVIDAPVAVNTAGAVTLSRPVPTGSALLNVVPQVVTAVSSRLTTVNGTAVDLLADYFDQRLSFSLLYDYTTGAWVVGAAQNSFGAPVAALSGTTGTLLLIGLINFVGGVWRINTRGLRYVFESLGAVEWYDNGRRALAQNTAEANADNLRVLRINPDLNDVRGYALGVDYGLMIDRLWSYPDGRPEPRRTSVVFADSDADGVPDRPDTFYNIVSPVPANRYLFWSNTQSPPYDQPCYTVTGYDTDTLLQAASPPLGSIGFQLVSSITPLANATFWVYQQIDQMVGWVQDTTNSYRFAIGRGPNVAATWVSATASAPSQGDVLFFHWQHLAPNDHRIDPSNTNIIDIFVLTYSYDTAIRQWIATGTVAAQKPYPPTELDLSLAFAGLEEFKMFSDTIVWRPVHYKFLFGAAADPALQAKFKVVRATNSAVSDGEIQSNILAAINAFFSVSKFDFGETFYFTELAAYIHQQLVGQILSVVIVPVVANGAFGTGFEIPCEANEIFISVAQVADIVLIGSNTATNLRIGS